MSEPNEKPAVERQQVSLTKQVAGDEEPKSLFRGVLNVPQQDLGEWMFQAIAPHERLWRRAKPASLARFQELAIANAKDTVRAALAVLPDGKWPTLDECIPPGSLLHDIDAMFYKGTNFPRELPLFNTLHYFSAMLLQHGSVISPPAELETGPWFPDLWTVALAESGSGKTVTQKVIGEILGNEVRMLPDPSSANKYVELLAENNGALWSRDEFGQFLKKLGTGPWEGGKDFLLRTHDHGKVETNTKKDGRVGVDVAKLTLFGSTVPGTIRSQLSLDSLQDGFAQRLTWMFATPSDRPRPPVPSFPGKAEIKERWTAIKSGLKLHDVYRVDEVGYATYVEAFHLIMERSGSESIPESFSSRLVMLAFKYAAIYHVILGKTDDVLHAEDMIYAARLVALNLRDLRKLLDLFEITQFGDVVEKAKAKVLALAKRKLKTDARTLQQGVRGLSTAERAFQMIQYLADDPECSAHLDMTPPKSLRKQQGFTGSASLSR